MEIRVCWGCDGLPSDSDKGNEAEDKADKVYKDQAPWGRQDLGSLGREGDARIGRFKAMRRAAI